MKCAHSGCRRQRYPNRKYCNHHRIQLYKERYPERYAFQVLRNNALRRGHAFTITFEYWKRFCKRTQLLAGRGIYKDSWHVDRINEELGYVPGNLQVLTNSENHAKYIAWSSNDGGKPNFKTRRRAQLNDESDYPF